MQRCSATTVCAGDAGAAHFMMASIQFVDLALLLQILPHCGKQIQIR
jgi:hypothetical protein